MQEDNQKIAAQNILNPAELTSTKKVFIGELSKDQFKSPRVSNKPSTSRNAISVDKIAVGNLKNELVIGSRE